MSIISGNVSPLLHLCSSLRSNLAGYKDTDTPFKCRVCVCTISEEQAVQHVARQMLIVDSL